MDIKTIAWAAGIYEGEGCFAGGHSDRSSRFVHVTQKDEWLCYRLQKLFGGSVAKYNGYYKWTICGDKARGFLLTIFSFLSPRRRKVILEGKDFFIQSKCKNGLHDYATSIRKEKTSKGIVDYCWKCRITKKIRNNEVRRRNRMVSKLGEE